MRRLNRGGFTLGIVVVTALTATGVDLLAQSVTSNPFRPIYGWGELPEGRQWGSTSVVEIAADGNIWVAERCGANTCVGSDVDPILLFDKEGNVLRSFGAGLVAWPHGIDVDHEGNVWIADAWANGATNTGHAVLKFSPQGELLMTIGTPGVRGDPPDHLTRPSDVLVAPNGQIYVVESHDRTVGRVGRYRADGTYMETWGELGYGPEAVPRPARPRDGLPGPNLRGRPLEQPHPDLRPGGRIPCDLDAVRPAQRHLHRRQRRHLRRRLGVQPGPERGHGAAERGLGRRASGSAMPARAG